MDTCLLKHNILYKIHYPISLLKGVIKRTHSCFHWKLRIELYANIRKSTCNGASFQLRGSEKEEDCIISKEEWSKVRICVSEYANTGRYCRPQSLVSAPLCCSGRSISITFPPDLLQLYLANQNTWILLANTQRSHSPYNFHINLEERYDSHGCHFF